MNESDRPLVTFALFAYNQEKFIREAVEATLLQTYSPLEIIVSDDCSNDRTYEIIREIASRYNGPAELRICRNEKNLGIGAHIQKVANEAHGAIIVMAAGDDVSQPSRVKKTVEAFQNDGEVLGFISGFEYFDENSLKIGLVWLPSKSGRGSLEEMSRGKICCPGASCAWSSRLFHGWTSLSGITHEDRVLPFRALLSGGKIESTDELLVSYRSIGGISRNSREDLLRNPKTVRINELVRILPDAKLRLLEFDRIENIKLGNKNCGVFLRKEISRLEMEINALRSVGIAMDYGYAKLFFSNSLTISSLRAYLKIRFNIIYVAFRKTISKW